MDPIVVLSPHLDDAVLSCGQLLAGRPDALVVTVMAGVPEDRVLRPYDRGCGFSDSYQAVVTRRAEDVEALRVLHARPLHLEFTDRQYDEFNDLAAMRVWFSQLAASDPEYVLSPVGIAHPDHATVARVAAETIPPRLLRFYEELPGRVIWPELVPDALAAVTPPGCRLERAELGTGQLAVKLEAWTKYRSQRGLVSDLEGGAGRYAIRCPERFWKVVES